MNNILIVSPAYPPYSGVGAARMKSLSKYLVKKGNNVSVIRNNPDYWPSDMLKEDIPKSIKIYDVNINKNDSFRTCKKKYSEFLLELLKNNKYDISIFSGNPFYIMGASSLIKKRYDMKYIIEFRDLWIYNERKMQNLYYDIKKKLYNTLVKHIERSAIAYAEGVVVVSERDKQQLQKHYLKYKDKIFVIRNGYDVSFSKENIINTTKNSNIFIGVFGKLSYYAPDLAFDFFKAVDKLNNDGYNIKILHIGNSETMIESIIKQISFNRNNYICTGYMNYIEGLKLLSSAQLCILIEDKPTGLGTKIYDYIYLNKPIIGIMNDQSIFSELLSLFQNGYICSNENQIYNSIKHIIDNNKAILDLDININKYNRAFQNEIYCNLINSIIKESNQ